MSVRKVHHPIRLLMMVLLLSGVLTPTHAASHRPRFGFQHFAARYTGGYSVVTSTTTLAGPASIRIQAALNGRSARVIWSNTFYTPSGSYRVALSWTFLPDGTVTANSLDPRSTRSAGTGTFTLNGNRPIQFSASAGGGTRATGILRLIGGGALSISATLTGLPEGDVTYSFSGDRLPPAGRATDLPRP